jgi:hypothetical protein
LALIRRSLAKYLPVIERVAAGQLRAPVTYF